MSTETIQIDPVFDPTRVGASLDVIQAHLELEEPLLRGVITGDEASRRKGGGLERDGLRPYEPGDDIHRIDWVSTAAQSDSSIMLRERHADITPNMWVLTDVLQSRYTHNPGYFSERDLGLSAVMKMFGIASLHGMPAAVMAVNDSRLIDQMQPAQGDNHTFDTAKLLARNMTMHESSTPERPSQHLAALLKYAGSRCAEEVVVVVSDFRDSADPKAGENGWHKHLSQLREQRNEIFAIELTNPWDYQLPEKADRLRTGNSVTWIGSGKQGRQHRADYAEAAQEQQIKIDKSLAAAGAFHIKLATDQPQWVKSFREQISRQA